ncbi:hypothetical protein MNBD_CHLOROFLEXI01-1528 [hydrothermal vent metagenome]|uniref:SH3b domain-containing protein n=1 Tax=hydrothermal vent metagenome TaxID=652676 RepID=A0A3B0UK10_9ZZZZ
MSNKSKLAQFDNLIEELEQEAKRPSVLNTTFKNELRGKLLRQYKHPRSSFATVGGWVGTAVALTLLAFAVFSIQQMFSSSSSATTSPAAAPISVTRPAPPIEADVVVETAVLTREALVVGTDGNGLTLRDSPSGKEIGILPEGKQVILVDGVQPVQFNDLLWQQVKVDDQIGWVSQEFLSILEEATTLSSPQATNAVWLLAATQQVRTSINAPITLEITVSYQFNTNEEVTLKPLYAAPNWESQPPGRVPIGGLGDAVVLDGRKGTVSFTFNGNPDEMRQIVGTDQPVLLMQLGYFVEDENGRRELKILAMPTLTQFNIDLNSIGEITFNTQ